jgi:hypothetical protein
LSPLKQELRFELSFVQPVVLALEPSADAWPAIDALALALLQGLPGRLERIYFLGNRVPYRVILPKDFREQSPAWFNSNRGRVSCIGPLLEDLERERWNGRVVVITSQAPVDIDDWMDSAMQPALLLARTGGSAFAVEVEQVDGSQSAGAVLARIDDPPERLELMGPGFAPLRYQLREGGTATVRYADDAFALAIKPRGERLNLRVQELTAEPPTLTLWRKSGRLECLAGQPEPIPTPPPDWQPLAQTAQAVVAAGIARQPFQCMQCGADHPYTTVLCPQGGPILRGIPLNSCVLFKDVAYLALTERFAYELADGERLITCDGMLYDWRDDRWNPLHRIEPYEEIDDGVWGLFHQL